MAAIDTFSESFDSLDTTTKWTQSVNAQGSLSVVGGRLRLDTTNTASAYSRLHSQTAYDLTNSSIYVQLSTPMTVSPQQLGPECGIQLDFGAWGDGNNLQWVLDGSGTLTAQWLAGFAPTVVWSAAFVEATHKWFRLRADATSVYWDTAPDTASNPPAGGDWVNRGSVLISALPFAITALHAHLFQTLWQNTTGDPTMSEWDGVNMAAGGTTTIPAGWDLLYSRDYSILNAISLNTGMDDAGITADSGEYKVGSARYRDWNTVGIPGFGHDVFVDPLTPSGLPSEYLIARPLGEIEPIPGVGIRLHSRPSTGAAMTSVLNSQFGSVGTTAANMGTTVWTSALLTTYRKIAAKPPFARATYFIPRNDATDNAFVAALWSVENDNFAWPNDTDHKPFEYDDHEFLGLGTNNQGGSTSIHAYATLDFSTPVLDTTLGTYNAGPQIDHVMGVLTVFDTGTIKTYMNIDGGAWTLVTTVNVATQLTNAEYDQYHVGFMQDVAAGFPWNGVNGAATAPLAIDIVSTELYAPASNINVIVPATTPPAEVTLTWRGTYGTAIPTSTAIGTPVADLTFSPGVTSADVITWNDNLSVVGTELRVAKALSAVTQPVLRFHIQGVKADGAKSIGRLHETDITAPGGGGGGGISTGIRLMWAADKPLYRAAGGREYLQMYSNPDPVSLGGSTEGICACFAVRFESGTYTTLMSDVDGAAATASNGYLLRFADGTLTFSVGAGTSRISVSLTGLVDGAAATDYVFTAWHDLNANTLNLQKNAETPVSVSCSTVNAGSSDMHVFSNPFADFSLGGWEGWDRLYGRFYGGLIFKNTSLTPAKRQDLVYWAATQAGIDLADISQPPTPPPPAPAPSPAPAPTVPTITNLAAHPHDWLKIGNYMVEDNRWGSSTISEGTASYQFEQSVERYLTVGANGEVAFRTQWRWPFNDQNGVEIAGNSNYPEIKCFPAIIYGEKPGYYGPDMWPAWDFAVRLPDGATVATPTPEWTPQPIKDAWEPLGGSVSTTTPSGSTGGNLPQQLPLNELWSNFRYSFNSTPTGIGHLSFDIWLQETETQIEGFTSSSITHEIMVPIHVWGNYGATHTEGGPWSKDPTNYSHDVAIGGTVYKVYVWKDKPTSPYTGEFTPDQYWSGLQYNFGGLNGAFTNEETNQPRVGWKFIVFEAQNIVTQNHPQDSNGFVHVDIAGIINHLTTRRDSRNIPYVRGTEYCVSVELGCEVVVGAGDLTVYDYEVTSTTAAPAPTPAPSPTPAPPPVSGGPNYPFGSRIDLVGGTSYPFGIMPSNYTAAQLDQRVVNCYNAWKANGILRRAPAFTTHPNSVLGGGITITDGYFLRFGNGGTVSEGIGYGMLITVIMAGYDSEARNIFNGLYKVARARPAYGHSATSGWEYLMDWKLDASMNSAGGGWNAPDGDEDIAQALLMAHRQWGSTGSINYLADAVNAINAMKAINFQGGIMYSPAQDLSRTSDYMTGHFRSFRKYTGDTFWDTCRTSSAAQISNIITKFSPVAKLVPDFIWQPYGNAQPSPGNLIEGPWEGRYGPNACRCPWRWGTDYIYSGDSTWGTFANNITNWIKNDCGGNPFNASPEFHLNGVPYGTHRYFAEGVVGPAMVGAMTSTNHQAFLNTLFTAHSDNFASTDYYDAELELIPLIVASGNWWNP